MGLRGRLPGQLRRAPAAPRHVPRRAPPRRRASSRIAAAEPVDVVRRDDAARAEAPHGLGEAADVVDDRRHAGAERPQERAALVELGAVREDGDGRLAERAVDLGLREERARRRPRRGAALPARARPPRARGRAACRAGPGRARAPCGRRRARTGSLGVTGWGITRSFASATPNAASVSPPALASGRRSARSGRTRGARARSSPAVRRGSRSCAVSTSGARWRSSHASSSGQRQPLDVDDVGRRGGEPRQAERVLQHLQRQRAARERPKSRDESG